MNIADALNAANSRLKDSEISESRREASSLLALALDRPQVFLIAHPEYALTAIEQAKFEEFVTRRANREPFHYITGHKEFYSLDFEVTPDVLIPRPETEILVEEAINELQNLDDPTFCEIGVGSGCISVSILNAVKTATAVGIDISDKALTIAGRNAQNHHVADRLSLEHGDLFGTATDKFDLIVSNPPYIPANDVTDLQPEVRDHEPHLALFSGKDGLDIASRIVQDAPTHLKPQGFLLMEIGFDQSEAVRELFDLSLWNVPELLPDMQGIPRIVKASIP